MKPPGAAATFYMSMGQAPPGSNPEMPTDRNNKQKGADDG